LTGELSLSPLNLQLTGDHLYG